MNTSLNRKNDKQIENKENHGKHDSQNFHQNDKVVIEHILNK